jgi:ABC-type branched-subunit amino acid transport system ATPase component/MFS family permease
MKTEDELQGQGRRRRRRSEPTPQEAAAAALILREPEVAPEMVPPSSDGKKPGVGSIGKNAKIGFLNTLEQARNWRELRRTPYGLTPVAILASIGFFQAIESQAFSVAGPDIARDLDINLRGIIGISQMVGVIVIFSALGVAYFFDRRPRAKWVGIGTILSGVAGLFQTQATNFGGVAGPRVVNNVSELASGTPLFSLLADYYPPESRGRVFALRGLSGRFSGLVAILLAGVGVEYLGWRVTGLLFAVPIVLVGIYATIKLQEPVRGYFERRAMGAGDDEARVQDEPVSIGEGFRSLLAVRTLRRSLIASAWGSAGGAIFGLLFPFFLADEYGLGPLERSLLSIPTAVVAIVGYYLAGGLIDFFSVRKPSNVLIVVGIFDLVTTVGLFGIAMKPPLAFIVLFSCINAFGFALSGPALGAITTQIIPPNARTLGGALSGLTELPGIVLFLPLAGSLQATFGYSVAFFVAVPFLIVSAIINLSAAPFFDLDRRNAFIAAMADQEAKKAKAEGRAKLLVARNVDVEYSGVQVLFNVDFEVEEGDIIALLGTNGAGKSTLLRAISGSQEASNGAILYDGRDITHMPTHEIAARGIVHMPGGRGVFPGLTVRENLLLGNWLTPDQAEVRRRLHEVYEIFPILKERGDSHAVDLSGGEQQQLSLAQAFLCNPRLLMIDELSLGLSPAVVGQLLDIVREIHRRGVTIIVVEQSVNVALALAEKAVFMEKGEVRFVGKTEDLLRRPDILRAVYVKGSGALSAGSSGGVSPDERRRRQELDVARPILEAEGLFKRFGGITAVDDLSLTLREGEILGIIGPNGSGKTTLFDLLSGYQLPDAGHVRLDGLDITGLAPELRARRKLIRRFQDARMFGSLTVYETILVALEQRLEMRSTFLSAFAAPQARRAERRVRLRADKLVEVLELGAFRDKFVRELSTGLRRIVDLACVLAAEPRVLLLDEPSSGIAQAESESLGPLLKRVRFETGCSMLLIEHDMPLISAVSDELIALDRGKLVVRGLPDQVLNDERVIESYLGGSDIAFNRSGSLA